MRKELRPSFMLLESLLAFFIITTSVLVISRDFLFYVNRVQQVQKQVQAMRQAYEGVWLAVYTSVNEDKYTAGNLSLSQPTNALVSWQYTGNQLKGIVYHEGEKEQEIYFISK